MPSSVKFEFSAISFCKYVESARPITSHENGRNSAECGQRLIRPGEFHNDFTHQIRVQSN